MTGRRAEDIVNHQNREEKLKITPDELRKLHRSHAEIFGNQPDRVVSAAANKSAYATSEEERRKLGFEAVSSAARKLTERNAVIEEHRVIEQALKYGHGRVLVGDIEEELAKQRLRKAHCGAPCPSACAWSPVHHAGNDSHGARRDHSCSLGGQGKLSRLLRTPISADSKFCKIMSAGRL